MKQITAYVDDALYTRVIKVRDVVKAPSLSRLLTAMLEQYCDEVEKEASCSGPQLVSSS